MTPEERYTDWKEIGQGAFGSVQKVFDRLLGRTVAIKLLKPEHTANRDLVAALYREVGISRDLRHPCICPIHDVYQGARGVGTVMDLINGIELSKWCRENGGRLLDTAAVRLDLLRKLTDALVVAHTRIVHRDLKPDNIFLLEGDPERPVIMDFGTAVVGSASEDGLVAGTPRYMAPEQWEAPDRVDQRSDLFALGIIAYELFTDRLPPTSLKGIMRTRQPPRVNLAEVIKPSACCAALPASLDRVILQLMAYNQIDRPQSAREVLKSLDAVVLGSGDVSGLGAGEHDAVALPGGTFHLGARGGEAVNHEKPLRQVVLSPFRIGRHPVTVREYRAFVESTGYAIPPLLDDPRFGLPNHPVVGVAFADALAYARWAGGTLPTEAQWEYAAKGGRDHSLYPWGDEPPTVALANIDNVSPATSPVDGCPAGRNPFGLLDLCGNVWEWCLDGWSAGFYRTLANGCRDPFNEPVDETRVLRGGGFDSFANQGRCSARFQLPAKTRGRSIGFRLVFPAP